MYELFNKNPLHFPSRQDDSCTLKQFLTSSWNETENDTHHLPIIVNVTALNTYGRSIKHLINKNSPLLLIDIVDMDSILAEYHQLTDSRHQPNHRHWLNISPVKRSIKPPTKFRAMKKLSKSVVSLASIRTSFIQQEDNGPIIDVNDKDLTLNERFVVKSLHEKRPSSTHLCRISINYDGYFELLNENDRPMEPFQKLVDLKIVDYDAANLEERRQRWPEAFFLRSSCTAYTRKFEHDQDEKGLNIIVDNDSDDVSSLFFNDDPLCMATGEVLTILGECTGFRGATSDREVKESNQPCLNHPMSASPMQRTRNRSLLSFLKKNRLSHSVDLPSMETISTIKSSTGESETFLKCRRQNGAIVYILMDETGLFTPINSQPRGFKSISTFSTMDTTGIFRLDDLINNFRFPISVRLVEPSIAFQNLYAPAVKHRLEASSMTAAKLRLLMPYNERVVFACPLHLLSSKHQKSSSLPTVIPISIHADILIRPCLNMKEIVKTDVFHRLMHDCHAVINQYQTSLSIIHFPLQLTNEKIRIRENLLKKRSQSESQLEYFQETTPDQLQYSDEQLNMLTWNSDESVVSKRRHQKLSATDRKLNVTRRSINTSKQTSAQSMDDFRYSDESLSETEDDVYNDVDQIYEYVRSGAATDAVQKIQAKHCISDRSISVNIPNQSDSINTSPSRQISSFTKNPGTTVTHRFLSELARETTKNVEMFHIHQQQNDTYEDYQSSSELVDNFHPPSLISKFSKD